MSHTQSLHHPLEGASDYQSQRNPSLRPTGCLGDGEAGNKSSFRTGVTLTALGSRVPCPSSLLLCSGAPSAAEEGVVEETRCLERHKTSNIHCHS